MKYRKFLASIIVKAFILYVVLLSSGAAWAEEMPNGSMEQYVVDLNRQARKHIYSEPEKAFRYAEQALEKSTALQDKQNQARALLTMGLSHLHAGILKDVRIYLEKSLTIAQAADLLEGQGDAYNFLGTYFGETGLYDQAMKNYMKALDIRTILNNKVEISKTINNLGIVQRKIGKYEEALAYFTRSLEMKGDKDASGRSNTLVNMGNTYKEQQNYEQALQYMKQALEVARNTKYIQGQAFALRSMGEVQLETGNLQEALENLLQAEKIYEKVNYWKGVVFSVYSIGRIYEEKGNPLLAMEYYQRSIEIAQRIGQKKLLGDIYYRCAKVAGADQKNQYYEKSIRVSQEIFAEEIKQRIALQQISYEADKQQHEIEVLKKQAELKALEMRNTDNVLMAIGSSLLLVGMLAIYLRQQLLLKYKKEQELLAVTHSLQDAKEALNRLAKTDHLTGLANRRCFDTCYQEKYNKAVQEKQTLAVIMIDIDLFKQYNDFYGHQKGDECLKKVAKELKKNINTTDWFIARYGGEEFVMVAQENIVKIRVILERARLAIEELNLVHSLSPFGNVTCSFGVASEGSLEVSTPEDLLKMADEALYNAKSHGRNCVNEYQGKELVSG